MNFFKSLFKNDRVKKRVTEIPEEHMLTVVKKETGKGPRIWAIAGGKGGVGKSFVTTNTAISLANRGFRVLIVDVDLGAANLHTFLGLEGSRLSLSSFLKGEVNDIERIITGTGIDGLDLISGAHDSLEVADLQARNIRRLRQSLRNVGYDYVVLDLGPGTSSNMLDLFLMSQEGVLLTTPEPTSIENTYRFFKSVFLRRIRNIIESNNDAYMKDAYMKEVLQRVFSGNWPHKIRTIADILQQIKAIDPKRGEFLKKFMGHTRISVLVNQTRTQEDSEIGPSISRACCGYFGVQIDYLTHIGYENCVTESIRLRKPLVVDYRHSAATKAIEKCVERLLNREKKTVTGGVSMQDIDTSTT